MDQCFCTTCGHRLGAGDLFCTACGAQVAPSAGAAEPLERAEEESPAERTAVREIHPVPTPVQPTAAHTYPRHDNHRGSAGRSRARFWGWIVAAAIAVREGREPVLRARPVSEPAVAASEPAVAPSEPVAVPVGPDVTRPVSRI